MEEIVISLETPMLFKYIWLRMHSPDQFFQKEAALLDIEFSGYFQGRKVFGYEPILFNDAWKKFEAARDLKIDKLVIPKNVDFDNLVFYHAFDFVESYF